MTITGRWVVIAVVAGVCASACGHSPTTPSGPASLTVTSLSAAVSPTGDGHNYDVQLGVSNSGGLTATIGDTTVTFLNSNAPTGTFIFSKAFPSAALGAGRTEQSNPFTVVAGPAATVAQSVTVQVAFTDTAGNSGVAARTISLPK